MRRNLSLHTMFLPGVPHDARRRAQADITAWIGAGRAILSVAAPIRWPKPPPRTRRSSAWQGRQVWSSRRDSPRLKRCRPLVQLDRGAHGSWMNASAIAGVFV